MLFSKLGRESGPRTTSRSFHSKSTGGTNASVMPARANFPLSLHTALLVAAGIAQWALLGYRFGDFALFGAGGMAPIMWLAFGGLVCFTLPVKWYRFRKAMLRSVAGSTPSFGR